MCTLTKGMFGHEFDPASPRFGLRCGQMRAVSVSHNGGWYNRQGEKLGWGDLSEEDIERIAAELEDDEIFIILSEGDSFWNFVERPGPIGSMSKVKPDVQAPGIEYVIEKANFIIGRNKKFYPSNRKWHLEAGFVRLHGDIEFVVISREESERLIHGL